MLRNIMGTRITGYGPDGDRRGFVRLLRAEGLYVTEWTDGPGAAYPEHSHPFREVRLVLEGALTMVVGSAEVTLGPGDRIDLDPGEPHSARIGEGGVRYLAGTTRFGPEGPCSRDDPDRVGP